MDAPMPIVVYPPTDGGGRRVRVDGEILGLAYSLSDLVEFLRRAGLDDLDEYDVADSPLIQWRGGGAADWGRSSP